MSHKTPWRRVLIEGLVIVLSILLAFGIEAGWQGRQESRATAVALGGLEAGFVESLSLIDEQRLTELVAWLEPLRVFLAADPDGATDLNPDEVLRVLRAIYRTQTHSLNSEELISLLDDEALHDLDDPDFRSATAVWRGYWRVVLDRQASISALQDEALRSLARHPTTRPSVNVEDSISADALRVARSDEDLVVLAAVKLRYLRLLDQAYLRLRTAADSVVSVIRAQRAR